MPLFTRQYHHSDIVVVPGILKRVEHLVDGSGSKCIQHPGAIDAHRRHTIGFGINNIFIGSRHWIFSSYYRNTPPSIAVYLVPETLGDTKRGSDTRS